MRGDQMIQLLINVSQYHWHLRLKYRRCAAPQVRGTAGARHRRCGVPSPQLHDITCFPECKTGVPPVFCSVAKLHAIRC